MPSVLEPELLSSVGERLDRPTDCGEVSHRSPIPIDWVIGIHHPVKTGANLGGLDPDQVGIARVIPIQLASKQLRHHRGGVVGIQSTAAYDL